jgi:peptidoglycan/LPS O-acetylase OafA/YrhL
MSSLFSQPIDKDRYVFLDFLRIFAFISVLVGHKLIDYFIHYSRDTTLHITIRDFLKLITPFFWAGGAGLIVFFLVSGYIITAVLQKETPGIFIIKRIFRIYPLYITAVILEIIFGYVKFHTPIPPLHILLPRLLLIGDFCKTPLALDCVEWSLRVEILFYAIMAFFKYIGLFQNGLYLSIGFMCAILTVQIFGPLTPFLGPLSGYTSLFFPFLFIGSIVYLLENKKLNIYVGLMVIFYIVISHLLRVPYINNDLGNAHFAIIGILLFLIAWKWQRKFKMNALVFLLSSLTYSVYLFHAWFWDYLEDFINKIHTPSYSSKLIMLFLLFTFCYVTHLIIEKPCIKFGQRLLRFRIRTSGYGETDTGSREATVDIGQEAS